MYLLILVFALISATLAAQPVPLQPDDRIISIYNQNYNDKGYTYNYETLKGLKFEEHAVFVEEADGGYFKVSGYYEYFGDDDKKYRVDYTADKNGFQPRGEHILEYYRGPEEEDDDDVPILRSALSKAGKALKG